MREINLHCIARPLLLIVGGEEIGVRQQNFSLKTNERQVTASQHNAARWESAHVTALVRINNSSAPALCGLSLYAFVELLACPCLLFSLGILGAHVLLWKTKGKDFDKRKLFQGLGWLMLK